MDRPFYTQGVGYYHKAFFGDSIISEANKTAVAGFVRTCESEGIGVFRVRKYYSNFRTLLRLDPAFVLGTTDLEAIRSVVSKINSSEFADATKADLKILLKKFYRVVVGGGVYPDCISWLKASLSYRSKKIPEDTLKPPEIEKLIKAAKNERDRCLVSFLWESGVRIGELASIRLKHVSFDDYGVVVLVPEGKTGPRPIRLVECEHYLSTWLAVHPAPERESFLFVNIEQKSRGKRIPYDTVRKVLKNLARRSGVPSDKAGPHNFRHSSATWFAQYLTEAQMCLKYGWVLGSEMPRIYVHLSGRDMDEAVLRIYGRTVERDRGKPRKCFRCKSMNGPGSSWCSVCKSPLDLQTALASEEDKQKELHETIKQELRKVFFEEMKAEYLKKRGSTS